MAKLFIIGKSVIVECFHTFIIILNCFRDCFLVTTKQAAIEHLYGQTRCNFLQIMRKEIIKDFLLICTTVSIRRWKVKLNSFSQM